MKKKKPVKKVQDLERSFVSIPEVSPDHWLEHLDLFFDENDAGLDHVRYMKEMGRGDVDAYYFTSGYETLNLFPERMEVGLRVKPKKSAAMFTRMGTFTMVYENTGCFRYALPEEQIAKSS
jgi:hypothetical protein